MNVLSIPEGYQRVMPYLILRDAANFLAFAKTVFGAEEKMVVMRSENVIMHAEITIGESVIMFADATENYEPRTAGFFIYVADADRSHALALEQGATSVTPVADQQYGRSGGVLDPFGNTWWVTSTIA